jgi:hypothetical protein
MSSRMKWIISWVYSDTFAKFFITSYAKIFIHVLLNECIFCPVIIGIHSKTFNLFHVTQVNNGKIWGGG